MVSLLEVPKGLEPHSGLLGGASRLRVMWVKRSLGLGLGTMVQWVKNHGTRNDITFYGVWKVGKT